MRRLMTVAAVVVSMSAAGIAAAGDSWKESFHGAGAGEDRESGCMSAENSARSTAGAACMARMGRRVDEEFGQCSCSSAMQGRVNTCQVSLKVTCEKSGR